jgi:hypothetical protein
MKKICYNDKKLSKIQNILGRDSLIFVASFENGMTLSQLSQKCKAHYSWVAFTFKNLAFLGLFTKEGSRYFFTSKGFKISISAKEVLSILGDSK